MVADSQKKGKAMSGGQRIDDHSAWMGSSSKESPLPMNSKMKQFNSAASAGSEMDYEDTTEKIKSQQEKGTSQAKGRPMKPGYRN